MGLVGYSDSEASDDESQSAPNRVVLPKPTAEPKGSFRKVVDKANPRKIQVSLPTAAPADNDKSDVAPPAKKPRLGGKSGGAFSGFNDLLPAPKKPTSTTNSGSASSRTVGAGLKRSISLKTGAAPAFSRDTVEESVGNVADEEDVDTTMNHSASTITEPITEQPQEVKPVGKPMMFRPLSVAGKQKKKRPPLPANVAASAKSAETTHPSTSAMKPQPPPAKPKVSLFSAYKEESSPTVPAGDYAPMMLESEQQIESEDYLQQNTPGPVDSSRFWGGKPRTSGGQTLDDIAADLNLPESARRQLFGRQKGKGGDVSGINVLNFDMDREYAANEELRAKGETVQHNPVRAIAPGKHSLRQLVNAASSQQDALEEKFMTSKRNKKEAGSKYGWA